MWLTTRGITQDRVPSSSNILPFNPLRLIHTCHAAPMPCRVNSHMPCRAPAILRQCRVLRESQRCSRNIRTAILKVWYASDNLRGTPRGSRKKPNAGRSPTCRLWPADANSHMSCHAMPMPMQCCAVPWPWKFAFRTAWSWHGTGAAWHVWIKHGLTV
jgi:hypothetical protein